MLVTPTPPWHKQNGLISLVRPPRAPRPLRLGALPEAVEIDATRCALIVIDMQNDFCHPEGWFGCCGVDITPAQNVIPAVGQAINAARSLGLPVVFLNWGIRADALELSPGILAKGSLFGQRSGYGERPPGGRSTALVGDSWGAETVAELAPQPHDIVVYKHRLSGFWHNELDAVLRRLDVTTLLFCGVNSDRCVLATLADATFLGYDAVLIEDATATPSPASVHDAALFLVRQLYGFTATVAALTAAAKALKNHSENALS